MRGEQTLAPARHRHARTDASVTVETVLDDGAAEEFYALYTAAFEPLRTRAVARQVLYRDEFFIEMRDPRVEKYVARDRDGALAGLTILTRHLETVPWISPEYFAARYPSHTARRAVFYLGFALVSDQHRRTRAFEQMVAAVVERLRAVDGICAYDICAYNVTALRFAENIESVLRRHRGVAVLPLDTQTYFCASADG